VHNFTAAGSVSFKCGRTSLLSADASQITRVRASGNAAGRNPAACEDRSEPQGTRQSASASPTTGRPDVAAGNPARRQRSTGQPAGRTTSVGVGRRPRDRGSPRVAIAEPKSGRAQRRRAPSSQGTDADDRQRGCRRLCVRTEGVGGRRKGAETNS
jgi:hypothetical protein